MKSARTSTGSSVAVTTGRILGAALAVAAAGVAAGCMPKAKVKPPSTDKIEATPERLARGKYLADGLVDCFTCHADHKEDVWGRPVVEETKGLGGFAFDEKYHVPGLVQAQNITSDHETGVGSWTDGELMRALREGINREGKPMFPMMPYEFFRHMSDEDARSIIVFIRTLKPVKNKTQPRRLTWMWENVILPNIPQPIDRPIETPKDTPVASWEPRDEAKNPAWKQHLDYGDYLVTIAGCVDCHTDHEKDGKRMKDQDFSGNYLIKGPWGSNRSANITPHKDTYIGKASKEQFIARFRAFAETDLEDLPKVEPGKNTFMPWLSFRHVTEQDLGAIYDFLKFRVKPIEKHVDLAGIYGEPPPAK